MCVLRIVNRGVLILLAFIMCYNQYFYKAHCYFLPRLLIFPKNSYRNVPNFVPYFSGNFASLCLKFPQTKLCTLCLSLLATNLPSVPYLGQSLLSLVVLRGLGPVPYFSKILHRNVPHFVSYFSGKVASLCLKFPQT